MSEHNGKVLIDRLTTARRSLERSMAAIDAELERRNEHGDYREWYVRRVAALTTQAAAVEDAVREALS